MCIFCPLRVQISISKEKMKQIASRLKQATDLFRRRMDWLTSESRRIFGVIQESVVIIILGICYNCINNLCGFIMPHTHFYSNQ